MITPRRSARSTFQATPAASFPSTRPTTFRARSRPAGTWTCWISATTRRQTASISPFAAWSRKRGAALLCALENPAASTRFRERLQGRATADATGVLTLTVPRVSHHPEPRHHPIRSPMSRSVLLSLTLAGLVFGPGGCGVHTPPGTEDLPPGAGGAAHRFTDIDPRWSHDGKRIAFVRATDDRRLQILSPRPISIARLPCSKKNWSAPTALTALSLEPVLRPGHSRLVRRRSQACVRAHRVVHLQKWRTPAGNRPLGDRPSLGACPAAGTA